MSERFTSIDTKGGVKKFILIALSILSISGFVLMDFQGGGNVGETDVARVEGEIVSIYDFDRTLRRAIAQYGITTQQAYDMGVAHEVLSGEMRAMLLAHEADHVGIAIGQNVLAQRVAQVVKPQMQEGQTLQDTLDQLLVRQGLTEKEFLRSVRKEIAAEMLMSAIRDSASLSHDYLARDLFQFQNQTRDVDVLIFPHDRITNVAAPSADQLLSLYERVKATQFAIPEYRTIRMARFDPETVDVDVTVSEQDIIDFYDDNQARFETEERYVLTQAVVQTKDEAAAIYNAVRGGQAMKDVVANSTDEKARLIEAIPFDKSRIIPAIAAVVLDQEAGFVSEPVQTTLGYHVAQIDDIVAASIEPLQYVRSRIREDLEAEKTADALYEIAAQFDNMLGEERMLDEISQEISLSFTVYGAMNRAGQTADQQDVLSDFPDADKRTIMDGVFEIEAGQTSLLYELEDGSFAAFEVTDIQPAGFEPFDTVKATLQTQYLADQQRQMNNSKVAQYVAEISTEGTSFDKVAAENGLQPYVIQGLKVSAQAPAPLSNDALPAIFQTGYGDVDYAVLDDGVALFRVAGITLPDASTLPQGQLTQMNETLSNELKDEVFLAYLYALNTRYDAQINNDVLARTYAQSQQAE